MIKGTKNKLITWLLEQPDNIEFEKSFGKTNERTLEQAKIIIYNEILDLIKEYEEK